MQIAQVLLRQSRGLGKGGGEHAEGQNADKWPWIRVGPHDLESGWPGWRVGAVDLIHVIFPIADAVLRAPGWEFAFGGMV